MAYSIFSGWLDANTAKSAKRNGVTIGDEFATWEDINKRSKNIAGNILPFSTLIVDANSGIDTFVALLSAARVQGVRLIWANYNQTSFGGVELTKALYKTDPDPLRRRGTDRSLYGTYTSGSSGDAKLPVGYADQIPLTGLQYDYCLYQDSLGISSEGGTLVTSLPLEYSATFMMAIMPAWATARNLIFVNADRWDKVFALVRKKPAVVITVPALLTTLCAAATKGVDGKNLTVMTTAGYLTRERISAVKDRFPNVKMLSSYGASETGVMTLDKSPDGSLHVGKPIFGKPVWLSSINDSNVGKVTTAGPDCREFYLGGHELRGADGSVSATDLGHFDNDGNLYLDGRIDTGQKLKGITIYPRRIERHILEYPNVQDVKVVIVNGEQVSPDYLLAKVVGDISENDVREHCESLPAFLRPKKYIIQSEETAYSSRGKI